MSHILLNQKIANAVGVEVAIPRTVHGIKFNSHQNDKTPQKAGFV